MHFLYNFVLYVVIVGNLLSINGILPPDILSAIYYPICYDTRLCSPTLPHWDPVIQKD